MPSISTKTDWHVVNVAHLSTGETISPDEQTGDEWAIERANPAYRNARVTTTYAVTKRPVDENGEWLDTCEIPDEEAHPHWRYAVAEQTELWIGKNPDDVWAEEEWSRVEYGQGSYGDFDTEEAADRECEKLARGDAAMNDIVTWDGQPFTDD